MTLIGRISRHIGSAAALAALLLSAAVPAAESVATAHEVTPECPRAMSMAPAAIEAEAVCLLRQYIQIF